MAQPRTAREHPVAQARQHIEAFGGARHRLRDKLSGDLGQGHPMPGESLGEKPFGARRPTCGSRFMVIASRPLHA